MIGTITTVTQEDISELDGDNKGLAEYIICVKSSVTTTH